MDFLFTTFPYIARTFFKKWTDILTVVESRMGAKGAIRQVVAFHSLLIRLYHGLCTLQTF
jgi:hypothetical protein